MILYLTEKPSQVPKLKAALEDVFDNSYKYDIVPLVGHVMEQWEAKQYPDGIKNWVQTYKEKKLPFVPTEWKKSVTKDKIAIYKRAKEAIERNDEVIIATDPDNEGVVLAMEVIESLNAEHKVIGMINMNKLDLASLKKEVKVTNKINYNNMNKAGNTRARGDWVFGMSGTVAATVILGNALQTENKIIHVGGVKSTVIRMVVERDEQFEKFKNIPFWQIKGIIEKDGKEFEVDFIYEGDDRFDKEASAQKLLDDINGKGEITLYKEQNKTTPPKPPLSLANLQSLVEVKYKIKGDKILPLAQSLYDKTYQSYPRTDNNYYAEGEYNEVPSIMKNLSKINSKYNLLINKMEQPYLKRKIFDDKKVTAHTALAPTSVFPSNITEPEKKVHTVTISRYLEQFLPDYKYLAINGEGKVNIKGLIFKFKNNVTQELGWKEVGKEIFNDKDENSIRKIPEMKKGEIVKFKKLWLHKGETKPKPRFTYKTLLEAMTKIETIYDEPEIKKFLKGSGIGQPATRDQIIKDCFTGKYFEYEKKKYIKSTEKSRIITNLLPEEMTSPLLRAKFESILINISEGKAEEKEGMDYIINNLKKFIKEMENIAKSKGFSIQGTKVEKKEVKDILCPLCSSKILKSEKSFVCSQRKWNPKTKKSSGCDFGFLIEQKPIGRKITEIELKELLEGKVITGSNGNKLSFDKTAKPFFSKIEWAQKANSNTKTSVKCPVCSKGDIIETDKLFKCSTSKWDPKTKKSSGCDFVLFKNQNKFLNKELKEKDLKDFIGSGIKGNPIKGKTNILLFDKNGKKPYYSKIEWGK